MWLAGCEASGDLDPETTKYKRECLTAIRAAWPEFSKCAIGKLAPAHLVQFRVEYRKKYCATRTNGAITLIREILKLARQDGYLSAAQSEELTEEFTYTKLNYNYQRMTYELPSPAELQTMRMEVYKRCTARGSLGGWLFDFLLTSGSRIEAANDVLWEDVHWDKNELYFRNAKLGQYTIPLFDEQIGRAHV